MHVRLPAVGLVALGLAVLHGESALAQARVSPGTQELQLYGGEMFGDDLVQRPAYGGRYTFDFTDRWGVQLSAGHNPSRGARVAGGAINLGLTTIDVDVLWNMVPGFRFVNRVLYPYTVVGVGYAWAHSDQPLSGVLGMKPVTITGGNGYTANIGFGVKYYLQSNLFIDFDARYRYLSRPVNHGGRGMNTGESTISIGYQF